MSKLRISRASSILLLALLAPGCAYAGGPRATESTEAAAPPHAVARVPFELNGSEIFLSLRVNGAGPLSVVLDTGALASVLDTDTVESLGLGTRGDSFAEGAGGRVESTQLAEIAFDVGGARVLSTEVAGLDLTSLENSMGRRIDGILGAELFRRYVVELDYERKEIGLYEPASFEYRGGGEVLRLSFYDNHPYVRAKVELPGSGGIEGEFVVDSGSNFPLILLPSFIEKNKLRGSLPPTLETVGRGVGGEVPLPIGRAQVLRLGKIAVERPVTAFPREGWFGHAGKAGNIGGAILRRFKVFFDYSRSRMILEPNGHFSEAYEHDMSGLSLVSLGPGFGLVRIHRVLAKSPAEEAGLLPGDEILSFGGRPVGEIGLAALREKLRQPGMRYPMEVKRGGEIRSVELETRRLI